MTAQLIDGNALSRQLRADVAARAAALKSKGITPGLAVVLVGDNPASQVYVRNKVKACEDSGLHSVLEKYDASMSEAALLARACSSLPPCGRAYCAHNKAAWPMSICVIKTALPCASAHRAKCRLKRQLQPPITINSKQKMNGTSW